MSLSHGDDGTDLAGLRGTAVVDIDQEHGRDHGQQPISHVLP
jgi:hypothetical protein